MLPGMEQFAPDRAGRRPHRRDRRRRAGSAAALRVAVLAGGCSGFQYRFELDAAPQADDLVIERAGAKVLVDPASLDLLAGSRTGLHRRADGQPLRGAQPERQVGLRLRHKFLESTVKIATWNVNSIRQRETHVQRWLEQSQPDILFLQEIKCETAAFPALTVSRPWLQV